jgi:hypothetical protein
MRSALRLVSVSIRDSFAPMSQPPQIPIAMEDRASDSERIYSPSAARNRGAITDVLAARLPEHARVLEIGSGTGEHAVSVCSARPDLVWQPSDPDTRSRASQNAWASASGLSILEAIDLDPARRGTAVRFDGFAALVCMNVIHISPWSTCEGLVSLASDILPTGGQTFLYGPYLEGARTAASNLEFDRSLKSRNPEWGVRSLNTVEALFDDFGFALEERIEMPSNNLSLVFKKRSL